jgi:hypothetical protein
MFVCWPGTDLLREKMMLTNEFIVLTINYQLFVKTAEKNESSYAFLKFAPCLCSLDTLQPMFTTYTTGTVAKGMFTMFPGWIIGGLATCKSDWFFPHGNRAVHGRVTRDSGGGGRFQSGPGK